MNAARRHADRYGMEYRRRSVWLIVVLVTSVFAIPAQESMRTVVNTTGAPLMIALSDGLDRPASRDAIITRIAAAGTALVEIAPQSAWRFPAREGVLVGYFGGEPSAVALGVIAQPVDAADRVVRIGPEAIVRLAGTMVTIAPWEMPPITEPVSLDGRSRDWQDRLPLMQFTARFVPPRIENGSNGEVLSPEDAALWGEGGSDLSVVRALPGRDWLYMSFETRSPIEAGTRFYLSVFPTRTDSSSAGEIIIAIDAMAGPVVWRHPNGELRIVGQYVARDAFIEFSISRNELARLSPNLRETTFSFDLASGRRGGGRLERYTYGVLYASELFVP